jgi:hypothetical protein
MHVCLVEHSRQSTRRMKGMYTITAELASREQRYLEGHIPPIQTRKLW